MDEGKLFIVNPDTGKRGYIDRSELDTWKQAGYQPETEEATQDVRLEGEYGNDSLLQTAGEGIARVATFGGSDVALAQLDQEGVRERQKRNPWAAGIGEVGGAVLTGGLGGGGLLTAAGEGAERAVVGGVEGQLSRRLVGGVVRGGVEGAGYGVGSGVSELAQDEKPLTWEGAAATMGSNVLGGAVLGGVIGGGAKLLSEGATAARDIATKQMEAISKGTAGTEAEAANRALFPEIAEYDAKATSKAVVEEEGVVRAKKATDIAETKTAQKAEEVRLGEQQTEQARKLYQEASAFKEEARATFIPAGDDGELAAQFGGSMDKIRGGLDNETGFVAKKGAGKFMEGLQEQETALKKAVARSEGVLEQAEAKQQALYDSLPKEASSVAEQPSSFTDVTTETAAPKGKKFRGFEGKVPEEPMVPLTAEQAESYRDWSGADRSKATNKTMTIPESQLMAFRQAVEAGEALPIDVIRAQRAPALLEKNQALQARFAEVQAKPTSEYLTHLETKLEQVKADATPTPRLQALKAHQADLQTPKGVLHGIATGLGGLAGGSVGFAAAGPAGAMAGAFLGRDVGGQIFERLAGKLVRSNAQRGQVIKSAIASMFAKGAGGVAKVLPSATKLIPAIQYATKEHADRIVGPDNMKPSKDATVTAFRQRARELNAVTEPAPQTPMGFQARMLALSDMHDRVAGLWQVAPGVANGVEKTQAAKWAFLASKLPRNPAPPSLQIGPDNWEPSKQQLSMFARYMEVAEDPTAAVTRLANGTITPGDVETLKAVWPGHYEDIRQQCTNHAATLQRTLPYVQRLNLSILLDVDVDPALTPAAMAVWQAPPPPPPEPQRPPGPTKPLPTGMVEPTQAQRMSSK